MQNELMTFLKEMISEEQQGASFSEEEKIRAAYALNMCMVSVSQIIDYNDMNILEQEYDGILNNLNLEMMPKDDALLSILKQLLDTITFFKMQEADKEILDKEYQYKMKNAIWSAIPDVRVILYGGNKIEMALSLATQVGIGYMNYRRIKAENIMEHSHQVWQLQRSAMEQFNSLRRELFSTAWRLADTYHFPDEYRLTEKQIKQYNSMLMDPDEIRRYERMTSISDKFIAYPPFWYFYGNTANRIARNMQLDIKESTREEYKNKAKQYFDTYWKNNKYNLLREDQLASACALEHADLLDPVNETDKIEELLGYAARFSGNAYDVLQLCAIGYLRIGKLDKAAGILRNLVNEDYNQNTNAQLLSAIYVSQWVNTGNLRSRNAYDVLSTRVNNDILLRMPEAEEDVTLDELKNEYEGTQKNILLDKFNAVVDYMFNELSISLGKLIPGTDPRKEYPDYYFSEEGLEQRKKDFAEMFHSSYKQRWKNSYQERLAESKFIEGYFAEINKFFSMVSELNCIQDRQQLQEVMEEIIVENAREMNQIAQHFDDRKASKGDIENALQLTSVDTFESFIAAIRAQLKSAIYSMNAMESYATADSNLLALCEKYDIPDPSVLVSEGCEIEPDNELEANYFGIDLLSVGDESQRERQHRYRMIEEIIRKHQIEINNISNKAIMYFHDDPAFNTYFEKSKLKTHKDILKKTIAVYDDKSIKNIDFLFTVDGIVPVIRDVIKKPITYSDLSTEDGKNRFINIVKASMPKDVKGAIMKRAAMTLVPGAQEVATLSQAINAVTMDTVFQALRPLVDEINRNS